MGISSSAVLMMMATCLPPLSQTASAAGDSTGSPTSGGHGSSATYPSPRTRMVREVVDDNRPIQVGR